MIPSGFAAYARILHPAYRNTDGARVRWAEAASANGRVGHAEMQWEAVATSGARTEEGTVGPPSAGEPQAGRLPPEETRVPVELLRDFVAEPEEATFAVWEGWATPAPLVTGARRRNRCTLRPAALPPANHRRAGRCALRPRA